MCAACCLTFNCTALPARAHTCTGALSGGRGSIAEPLSPRGSGELPGGPRYVLDEGGNMVYEYDPAYVDARCAMMDDKDENDRQVEFTARGSGCLGKLNGQLGEDEETWRKCGETERQDGQPRQRVKQQRLHTCLHCAWTLKAYPLNPIHAVAPQQCVHSLQQLQQTGHHSRATLFTHAQAVAMCVCVCVVLLCVAVCVIVSTAGMRCLISVSFTAAAALGLRTQRSCSYGAMTSSLVATRCGRLGSGCRFIHCIRMSTHTSTHVYMLVYRCLQRVYYSLPILPFVLFTHSH